MIDYESVFDQHRRFLWSYCYRLTGSAADAEDTVQETFVRAMEKPPADVDRPWRPWLVCVATNLVRDGWRSRRNYVGPWLPSPIDTDTHLLPWKAGLEGDVQGRYEALESVSFAFLLALEALTPRQRAVLILRDVYDYSGRESAEALDLTVSNVKTTLHRARRAIEDYDRNRQPPTPDLAARHQAALERLLECFATRDARAMERLLADDIRARSDGGGSFYAAKVSVIGRERVALFFSNIVPNREERLDCEIRTVNGLPAMLFQRPGAAEGFAPRWMFRVELDSRDQVSEAHAVLATRKLSALSFREIEDGSGRRRRRSRS